MRMDSLNGAASMLDLRSIRVNDRWRLIFRWQGNDVHKVRLTDYH